MLLLFSLADRALPNLRRVLVFLMWRVCIQVK